MLGHRIRASVANCLEIVCIARAHPGFLERGFMYNCVGDHFADFVSFFLNIP